MASISVRWFVFDKAIISLRSCSALACPAISDDESAVVTGRFISRQVQRTAAITFQDGTVLEGTLTHPIWSVDRQDWIGLAELQTGEQVMGSAGLLAVAHVTLHHRPVPVYNLEVLGEHVYQVTNAGILVHNDNYLNLNTAKPSVVPVGLRRNDNLLAANLGCRIKGHTPHHFIPVAVAKTFDVMKRAAELGYNINRGTNGINLPNKLGLAKRLNLPYHPKGGRNTVETYTGPVENRLLELQRRYDTGLVTDKTLLDEIQKIEDLIHDDLISGVPRLNSRYPWYPKKQ